MSFKLSPPQPLAAEHRVDDFSYAEASHDEWLRRRALVIGVRALLVHAINERARLFYSHYGFVPSPANPMMLMLPLHAKKAH